MKHKDIQTHMTRATLLPEEKDLIRQSILDHVRSAYIAQPIFGYGYFWQSLRFAATGVAGVALAATGISYAAENALPGDMLYPVKIEVSERVRMWVALSEEAEAEWSVARTTRRLEELERLATGGDLNDTLGEEIVIRLEQNTEEASKAIVSLKKDQMSIAADTSSRLESSLRVHERMLAQVAEERADMSSQIHIILDMVRKKAESVSEIRQEIEKELADATTAPIEDTAFKNKDVTSTSSAELLPEQKVKIEILDKVDVNSE